CSGDGWCFAYPRPTGNQLSFVHAFAADDVWITGAHGTLMHWNGIVLQKIPVPFINGVELFAGTNSNDVWIGNLNDIYHWNGTAFSHVFTNPNPIDDIFSSIYAASAQNVWLVSDLGRLYHFTGGPSFDTWPQTFASGNAAYGGIPAATGPNDIYVL